MVEARNRRVSTDARAEAPESGKEAQAQISKGEGAATQARVAAEIELR
jgi:hypothetical protein